MPVGNAKVNNSIKLKYKVNISFSINMIILIHFENEMYILAKCNLFWTAYKWITFLCSCSCEYLDTSLLLKNLACELAVEWRREIDNLFLNVVSSLLWFLLSIIWHVYELCFITQDVDQDTLDLTALCLAVIRTTA